MMPKKLQPSDADATGQLLAVSKKLHRKAIQMLQEMGVPEEEIPERLAEIKATELDLLLEPGRG